MVKELNGFIYLNKPKDKATTAKLLFIDRIQFVRMRKAQGDNVSDVPQALRQKRTIPVMKKVEVGI